MSTAQAPNRVVWERFVRGQAVLSRELDDRLQAEHDLTLSAFELMLLADSADAQGGVRMTDVAESLVLTRSGITRLVDSLEKRGFVHRVPCKRDGRVTWIRLTRIGSALFRAAAASHQAAVQELFFDRFSEDELATLNAFLERLPIGRSDLTGCGMSDD